MPIYNISGPRGILLPEQPTPYGLLNYTEVPPTAYGHVKLFPKNVAGIYNPLYGVDKIYPTNSTVVKPAVCNLSTVTSTIITEVSQKEIGLSSGYLTGWKCPTGVITFTVSEKRTILLRFTYDTITSSTKPLFGCGDVSGELTVRPSMNSNGSGSMVILLNNWTYLYVSWGAKPRNKPITIVMSIDPSAEKVWGAVDGKDYQTYATGNSGAGLSTEMGFTFGFFNDQYNPSYGTPLLGVMWRNILFSPQLLLDVSQDPWGMLFPPNINRFNEIL